MSGIKMKDKSWISIVSILCLTAVYLIDAIYMKIDHAFMMFLISIIAGIAGYHVRIGVEKQESYQRDKNEKK